MVVKETAKDVTEAYVQKIRDGDYSPGELVDTMAYVRMVIDNSFYRQFGNEILECFKNARETALTGKVAKSIEIPYRREMAVLGIWTQEMQAMEDVIKELYAERAKEYLYSAIIDYVEGVNPSANLSKAIEFSKVSGKELPPKTLDYLLTKYVLVFPENSFETISNVA